MNYVSLFSGIGGFDLGFDRAGMTCVAQVERDTAAADILARHWPDVAHFDDVCTFGKDSINGPVDLICGGFPCQDLSVAGRRAGLAGERSGLWFEFARIAGEFRPQWVVIENVPGLLSSNGGRDFAVILHGLGQFGYLSAWRILDAQYFGVAQRRRRVFVVASLGDGRAAQVLFESDSVRGDSAPRREAGQGIANAIRASLGSGGADDNRAQGGHLIAGTLTASYADASGKTLQQDGALVYQCHGSNVGPMGTLRQGNGDVTGGVPFVPIAFTQNQSGDVLTSSVMHSIGTNQNATGRNTPKAHTAHGVRRLMPVECERLQGFPDGWTAGQSDSARYRQTGNAVAVPVAEWIGRRIVEANQP